MQRHHAFHDHIFAADIGNGAQPVALIHEIRLVAKGVNSRHANGQGGLDLHFQQLSRELKSALIKTFPRLFQKGFAPTQQNRLANAQIVDALGHAARQQQRQRRRVSTGNPIERHPRYPLNFIGMGLKLAEVFACWDNGTQAREIGAHARNAHTAQFLDFVNGGQEIIWPDALAQVSKVNHQDHVMHAAQPFGHARDLADDGQF